MTDFNDVQISFSNAGEIDCTVWPQECGCHYCADSTHKEKFGLFICEGISNKEDVVRTSLSAARATLDFLSRQSNRQPQFVKCVKHIFYRCVHSQEKETVVSNMGRVRDVDSMAVCRNPSYGGLMSLGTFSHLNPSTVTVNEFGTLNQKEAKTARESIHQNSTKNTSREATYKGNTGGFNYGDIFKAYSSGGWNDKHPSQTSNGCFCH